MEEEDLLPKEDLQLLNPLPDTNPSKSGYEAYKNWANSLPGNEMSTPLPLGDLPGGGLGHTTGNAQKGQVNTIAEKVAQANAGTLDSTKYSMGGEQLSRRYPTTFKDVDNEELYAGGQTLGSKAYNGVAKMVGTATTTFINGTVGTVYGIMAAASAEDGHKVQAFYNNDLADFLNNVNVDMEDSYAHYKTARERNGDWWEPSNLFTANFLFDNVIKNLGFSVGAMGAGFAWGGALKALGITGKLMGTGQNMATAADKVIADAALLPEAERLSAITRGLNSLKSTAGNALMKADRGIVATFGTFGESGIEALNNAQQFREQAIQAYTAEHGYAPDKEELAKIDEEAHSVGDWSFKLNTALLTATNYIQLPKIYSSAFKAEKAIANDIALVGERYASTLPEKGFGKLMYKAKNIASLGFNTSEAFEEGAQYAIQTGTQHYFDRKYRGKSTDAGESILYGVKEALTSDEGTLNIFTGGFSGALQSSGIVGIKGGLPTIGKTGKIGERGFTGYGGEQAKVRNEAITALNNTRIKDKFRDVYANIKTAEDIQSDREAAIRRGDILESKDLEFDYAHTFVSSRLKYGAQSAINQEIDMLKEEAVSDFTSLQQQGIPAPTDTKDTFIRRLDNLKLHAEHASKMYDAANLKYGGLIDEKGNKVYSDEIIDQLVYAGSKVMDYNRRIPQMQSELSGYDINLEQIVKDVIAGKDVDEATLDAKIDIEARGGIQSDDLMQTLDDVVEASLRRNQFVEEYKDISKNPKNYKRTYEESPQGKPSTTDTAVTPEGGVVPQGEAINVTTKGGAATIYTGKEYVLGRVVEYDKDGYEVYRAPRLTIIGENEDGTIKVRLSSGLVRDINKEDLEDYKLVPVEKVEGNKKLAYYMANWNNYFKHYGIKKANGDPVQGRLEYSDKDRTLLFVYKDRRGNRQEIEVTGKMFNPASEKYKHGMIVKAGELTAAEVQARDEFVAEKDDRAEIVLQKRMDIMIELSEDLIAQQDKTKKLVANKQATINKLMAELEQTKRDIANAKTDARYKNRIKFKKVTTDAIQRAMDLSRMIRQLEKELEAHEADLLDLENNLEYVDFFLGNLEDYPTELNEFVKKLRLDRKEMVNTIISHNKTITLITRLLKSTQRALDLSVAFVRDIIENFASKHPDFPLSIRDVINDNIKFLNTTEAFDVDLAEAKEAIEFIEEGEIIPSDYRINDLQKHLAIVEEDLSELEKHLKAHDLIIDTFKDKLQKYYAEKREEEDLAKNEEIKAELLGTNSITPEATRNDPSYEPTSKKSWINVVSATIAPNDKVYDPELKKYVDAPLREHHKRANRFGIRMGNGDIPIDTIHGYIVTKKTEKAAGVPDLTMHLAGGNEKVDEDKIIAMVMVKKNLQGEYELVNEFGEFLTDEQKKDPKEHAVYQVFPKEDLEHWSKGAMHSMFREDVTPEQVTVLKNEYAAWRNGVLQSEELNVPEIVDASFGVPEYVVKDGKRDYDVRTSVKDAKLIDPDQRALLNQPVVHVATINDIYQQGTTVYNTPLGFVFLETKTGAVKLQNKKFSKEEAETIYKVILQITKNIKEFKTTKTKESQDLMNWLKSVIYWGTPVNKPGYNSVWFDNVKDAKGNIVPRLFMSGKGLNFPFTETGIEENKTTIISILESMYGNTNATLLSDNYFTLPYYEITGMTPEGKPIETKWPNYQSFLLSDKRPDGSEDANLTEPRDNKAIPLVTNMAPVVGESTNRAGIYFIRRNTNGTFTEPIPPANPAPQAAVVAAPAGYDVKRQAVEDKRTNNLTIIDSEGNKITRYENVENMRVKLEGMAEQLSAIEDPLQKASLLAEIDTLTKAMEKEKEAVVKIEQVYAKDLADLSRSTVPTPVAPAKVSIRNNTVFVPKPGQYDLSGKAIEKYVFEGYEPVRFRMRGDEAMQIIADQKLVLNPTDKTTFAKEIDILVKAMKANDTFAVDITQATAIPMMQAAGMSDPNLFTMSVMSRIMQEVVPQLTNKATPVEPALDNPAPIEEVKNEQPTIVETMGEGTNVVVTSTPVAAANLFNSFAQASDPEASTEEGGEVFTMGSFASDNPSTPPETGDSVIASVTSFEAFAQEDVEETPEQAALRFKNSLPLRDKAEDNEIMRAVLEKDITTFKPENWEALTAWLAEKFPNIPVFRVKNVIKNTNGKQAWGLLQDGAIYVYENAEIGTIYHEVFEAVWKMFATPKEKVAVVDEFRNREGEFKYAFSGEMVKYREATDEQVRETLAEEFRDFVHSGVEPVRNVKRSVIGQIFHDIVNFIKEFFTGKEARNNTKKLFDKIGDGYYAKYNPYQSKLELANPQVQTIEKVVVGSNAVFRLVDVPEVQAHEIIEHMTYKTLTWVLTKRQNIFREEKQNKKELYSMLKTEILGNPEEGRAGIINTRKDIIRELRDSGKKTKELADKEMNDLDTLWTKVFVQWEDVVKRHQLYLKQKAQLTFDENDEVEILEEKSNKAFEGDARKIDTFRKANSMIRLMLSTLPQVTPVEVTTEVDGKKTTSIKYDPLPTSVGGNTLIPSDEVFIDLMNELHSSTDPVQMINKLGELGQRNSSYSLLYQRLTKNPPTKTVSAMDVSKFDDTQNQLITAFWKTMKKAKPNVVAVYILPGGEVVIGDASLASASKKIKKDFINDSISKLKSGPYLTYNVAEGTYNPTEVIKNLSFDKNFNGMIAFLKAIGIDFTLAELNSLNTTQKNAFRDSVLGIRNEIAKSSDIKLVNSKTLNIDGNMLKLATLKASLKLKNKFESTYFNLNGERTQAFIGTNVVSDFYDVISTLNNIKDLAQTKYAYLLTDVFSKGTASLMLNKMFDIQGDGRRRENTSQLAHIVDVSGIIDEDKGKKKESSKLNYKQRFIQELNLNFNGIFLNLVPGDASIEHAIKMHMEGSPFVSNDEADRNSFLNIFKNYFISEVLLARDNRTTVNDGAKNTRNLRFFKDILPEDVHASIIKDTTTDPEKLYKDFEAKINSAVIAFIDNDAQDTFDTMRDYGIIAYGPEGMYLDGVDFNTEFVNEEIVKSKIKALTVNYMIANIEMHKLYYSDPYQYKDELKRIKNFNSPRQPLFYGSKVMNTAMDASYNRGFGKKDIGWSDMFKEWFDTVTLEDVLSINKELGYDPFESTDGGALMYMNAFRIMRIRASNWTDSNELQWRYDIAYEKTVKGLPLNEEEAAFDIKPVAQKDGSIKYIGKNPGDQSTYTTQKPIVSGSKLSGRGYNDIVMDKYALMPLSFRVLHEMNPNSNALKLYNKMQRDNIDYGVYASGRKVGAERIVPLYDKKGNFDETTFRNPELEGNPFEPQILIKVPFSIMAIQAEVPSKVVPKTTEGSQITQLATLDYMEAGVPKDFQPGKDFDTRYAAWFALPPAQRTTPLYEEIKRNQKLLEVRIEQGYQKLLRKSGISLSKGAFVISDVEKLIKTISDEILSREVNENIVRTFEEIKNGDVILEATPAYKQIRNALYAMADKNVLSKKITGRMAVQVAATLQEVPEGVKAKVVKNSKGEDVTVYVSDTLDFYSAKRSKNGKVEEVKVCEIMVARWFDSTKTDDELMDYFNNTEEGQKQMSILAGVAFRIPTQKQNSIDAFKIKKFLPREFGDNVVIPTELVVKTGSDFDIDKLSIYFKNVRTNKQGYPELVQFLDNSNSTVFERYRKYISDNFDDVKNVIEDVKNSDLGGNVNQAYYNAEAEKIELNELNTLLSLNYNLGKEIFKTLPVSIKQDYWDENKRLDELEYSLPEKIILFRKMTKEKFDNAKDPKLIKTLNQLLANYDNSLEYLGITKEMQSKLNESFKTANTLNDKLREEIAFAIADKSGMETIEEFSKKDIYLQNTREAIDNEYVESLYNLITNPLNFDRLVVPNSAKPLQDLNDEVGKLMGRTPTDYSSAGQMLKRGFMSSLRHAFVTGKYAIGIAAIAQTNHSQNQRSLIYIDDERLEDGTVTAKDKTWLGDGEIKFQEYNSVNVNGKKRPTFSMVYNAAGEYISDIIGMFIDGYVDIAKGPWIMELGAAPNVAGTWLALIKMGVPVRTVAYFMNQPIIRDYLRRVENAGYSYLFIDNFVEFVLTDYGMDTTTATPNGALPSEAFLGEMLKKDKEDMSPAEMAIQRQILLEFLKYAKMSEHLFLLTQGTNYNTASFTDPLLLFQKEKQLEKSRRTIISSSDNILDNSHIGKIRTTLGNIRKAFATILLSERRGEDPEQISTVDVVENVMEKYVDLNSKEFLKIGQKLINNLFDWAVQTVGDDKARNNFINEILVGKNGKSVADQVMEYKYTVENTPDHPLKGNAVLESFSRVSGDADAKVNNLFLSDRDNKVYDQNIIINSFRELREQLRREGKSRLYQNLVGLSILQSGLNPSPINFTALLPYEDFVNNYQDILSKLENNPNLAKFTQLKAFERNSWSNTDIVPFKKFFMFQSKKGKWLNPNLDFRDRRLTKATTAKKIPMVINISLMSREGNNDVITYSWNDTSISKTQRNLMRRKGDYSYVQKGLFQKVYTTDANGNRTPLVQIQEWDGKVYKNYVYKAINAWGDSFKAQEFYLDNRQSVLDNGYIKVNEVDDNVIVSIMNGTPIADDKIIVTNENTITSEDMSFGLTKEHFEDMFFKQKPETTAQLFDPSLPKVNIYAGTGENADLSNFATRPFKYSGKDAAEITYQNVEIPFQKAKLPYADKITDQPLDVQSFLNSVEGYTAAQAKALGQKIKGLNVKGWDMDSSKIMKDLIKQSFEQNPEATKRLLDTGNAELTHTQDKGKWGTEFPRLLMEVRSELRTKPEIKGVKKEEGEFFGSFAEFVKEDIENIKKKNTPPGLPGIDPTSKEC